MKCSLIRPLPIRRRLAQSVVRGRCRGRVHIDHVESFRKFKIMVLRLATAAAAGRCDGDGYSETEEEAQVLLDDASPNNEDCDVDLRDHDEDVPTTTDNHWLLPNAERSKNDRNDVSKRKIKFPFRLRAVLLLGIGMGLVTLWHVLSAPSSMPLGSSAGLLDQSEGWLEPESPLTLTSKLLPPPLELLRRGEMAALEQEYRALLMLDRYDIDNDDDLDSCCNWSSLPSSSSASSCTCLRVLHPSHKMGTSLSNKLKGNGWFSKMDLEPFNGVLKPYFTFNTNNATFKLDPRFKLSPTFRYFEGRNIWLDVVDKNTVGRGKKKKDFRIVFIVRNLYDSVVSGKKFCCIFLIYTHSLVDTIFHQFGWVALTLR